jgi:hypothetical protein
VALMALVLPVPSFQRIFTATLPYALGLLGALIVGFLSSYSDPIKVAIFLGLVLALAALPSRGALVWFIIIGGLIVVGVAQLYLPGSKYLRYVVPLAAFALLAHGFLEKIVDPRKAEGLSMPSVGWWAVAFLLCALASTAANSPGVGVTIIGLKGYFQVWAFFFALLLIQWSPRFVQSLPRAVLLVAFAQLPFVAHEYFVLVPRRMGLGGGVVPQDVIAGTFGATETGGGANAVLAAFLFIVIGCLMGLWKRGALSTGKLALLVPILLSPVFVNETKISAIYLPLVFVVVFFDDIVRRPGRFILLGGVAFVGLAGLVLALVLFQPNKKVETWQDLISYTIERQSASIQERSGTGQSELSRFTALTFWAKEHANANVGHILIGHGLGASRVREAGLDLGDTLADTRYGGLEIGYTSVSALLWDTGVVGLALTLGMFYSAFRAAGRLAKIYASEPHRAGIFEGLRGGIAVLVLSLAHRDFWAFHLPYQILVLLVFGYIAVCSMQAAQERRRVAPGDFADAQS